MSPSAEQQEDTNATSAYPAHSNCNPRWLLILSVFFMILFRNLFFRDYNSETKDYLKSIGREDVIDNVIPKTYNEVKAAQTLQEMTFKELVANMTITLSDVKQLQTEMHDMKSAFHELKHSDLKSIKDGLEETKKLRGSGSVRVNTENLKDYGLNIVGHSKK
jgi:2-oxoglutarate dehydrogenase complex dehydrogenase (E1) component-like enzyme